jgi:hypothetical protein
MKTQLLAVSALALAGLVAGTPPSSAAAPAPTVEIKPRALDRGADVPDPHVEGRVIHDGSTRLAFRAPRVTLLGTSGRWYVVHLSRTDGSHARVMRIDASERQKVLVRGLDTWQVLLSDDGRDLVTSPVVTRDASTVVVRSVRAGDVVGHHVFRGAVNLLDADGSRAVLGSWGPRRTFWWSYRSDETERINNRVGYAADIAADRVASLTGDPYRGGCSVVTDLAPEPTVLSRSCEQMVAAFAPDGRRMATIHLLTDGLGPTEVGVRRTSGGALLTRYEAPSWFGAVRWESDTSLLLDTYGRRSWATVRCDGTDCERASDLRDTPTY